MILRHLQRISDYEWLYPKHDEMKVDGLIFGSLNIIEQMSETLLFQLKNIASLPGVMERVVLLPNASAGVGFPNGCVAAFDNNEGIIAFEGSGFDVNCGIRFVSTNLIYQDIEKKVDSLIKEFYRTIPSGVAINSRYSLNKKELLELLDQGARWIIEKRCLGKEEDLDYIEDNGETMGGVVEYVSEEALKREKNQLGTLGSGDHYLELQAVDEIFDIEKAKVYGLFKNQVIVTFHTGSRGIGHQIAVDYLSVFHKAREKYNLKSSSEDLLYLPINTEEAKRYLGAIRCASNFAFANRQVIAYTIDKVFNDVIKDVETNTLYDLGHNTVKEELHKIGNSKQMVILHRRGCSRNYAGRMPEVPKPFKVSGHPVFVGGGLGNPSYIFSGREESVEKTFGSMSHGVARKMSRVQSKNSFEYEKIIKELHDNHINLRSKNKDTIIENAPNAFQDIEELSKSVSKSNLSQRVARLKPIGIVKG